MAVHASNDQLDQPIVDECVQLSKQFNKLKKGLLTMDTPWFVNPDGRVELAFFFFLIPEYSVLVPEERV